MPTPKPAAYADGLGELVRAHRLYCNLSQRTFAEKMGIKEKSLSDIEVGRRSAPPGFLDSVDQVVTEFDQDVEMCVEQAEVMVKDYDTEIVHLDVSGLPKGEWQRSVLGRAAVESGLIMPILCEQESTQEAG